MKNASTRANGGALHSSSPDPLLTLIKAFQAERAALNANDDRDDAEFSRLFDQLMDDTPICRTNEGAAVALRLVADDLANSSGGFQEPVLTAVLDYLQAEE